MIEPKRLCENLIVVPKYVGWDNLRESCFGLFGRVDLILPGRRGKRGMRAYLAGRGSPLGVVLDRSRLGLLVSFNESELMQWLDKEGL